MWMWWCRTSRVVVRMWRRGSNGTGTNTTRTDPSVTGSVGSRWTTCSTITGCTRTRAHHSTRNPPTSPDTPMPDDRGRLFAGEVAEQAGIRASDWRARVSRGYAPKPVGYVRRAVTVQGRGTATVTAVAAVWDPQEIAEYL